MVMMVVVVLPRLDLIRATGAVNRLEKFLHHRFPLHVSDDADSVYFLDWLFQ